MFKYCLEKSGIDSGLLVNYTKYSKSCIEISQNFLAKLEIDLRNFRGILQLTSNAAIDVADFLQENVGNHFSIEVVDTEFDYKKHYGDFLEECLRNKFFEIFK